MAGLEFALAADKDFIGKYGVGGGASSGKAAAEARLVSLNFTDADVVPLGNEPVVRDGRIIGKTTSAAFGYRVGRPVGIALLHRGAIDDGALLQVDIAGVMADARLSVRPLFDPSGQRMRHRSEQGV